MRRAAALGCLSLLLPLAARAGGIPGEALEPETVVVTGSRAVTDADSASIGTVYAEQFENRPLSRPGELLEVVPGLIVTQHSGEGKANQYFLRGFNLDHGTDFATFVDGMPVNMPTHAHGQGYSDANFLIPELIDSIEYRKGPYYAAFGDFSSAGAASLRLRDRFEGRQLELAGGFNAYARGLTAGAVKAFGGDLLYGLEGLHYDGPWDRRDDFNKGSGVLRYSRRDAESSLHLTAMGYDARWDASDQIPQRAVAQHLISRLGCIDCTDGGKTYRYSLSGDFERRLGDGSWSASAYAIRYRLDLFSNFTYFLNDPVRGDQFEQYDRRGVYGGQTAYRFDVELPGVALRNEIGLQTRYDDIAPVALYHTQARRRLGAISESSVREWARAVYAQSAAQLAPWLRATAGLRFDHYRFHVGSDLAANSGGAADHIVSPKLSLVFGPFDQTEYFLNLGKGFHSNDARGTTETIDPNDGVTPVSAVTPLVAARGADLGLRTSLIPDVQLAANVFWLHLDSELTFSGDGGNTEPNRPSRRYGGELALYWTPVRYLVIDTDVAYTRARFSDRAPQGDHIPEAATAVAALGLSYDRPDRWFGALRLRYFGPRPLIEDASVHSRATTVVNVDAGYHFSPRLRVAVQVLNLLNSKDHDIDYYFASRLSDSEPAFGVDDIHFHPVEPVSARLLVAYRY